jgi:hypothetical protein
MPKSPLDSILDGIDKIQQLHVKGEEIRRSLDRIDPLKTVTDTVTDVTDKINMLDASFARTKRRTRRQPPKQE